MPASSAGHEAVLAALVLECLRNALDTVPYSASIAGYSVLSACRRLYVVAELPCVSSSHHPRLLFFQAKSPGPYMPLLHHQSPRRLLWFLFSFNSHAALAGSSLFSHSCTIIKNLILATRFELLVITLCVGGRGLPQPATEQTKPPRNSTETIACSLACRTWATGRFALQEPSRLFIRCNASRSCFLSLFAS